MGTLRAARWWEVSWDEELWFEEEIAPAETKVQDEVKFLKTLDATALPAALGDEAADLSKGDRAARIEEFMRQELHGKVGVSQLLAQRVTAGEAPPDGSAATVGGAVAYAQGKPYLVRLGLVFELSEKLQKAGYRY